ncbi:MAG: helix-hairpin-helix domain-containing protein [Deltaproteobacteria bacterium]|nr:helix-hairpin-helix domain-containing protein [Deltaproteobacteria bacterium]
MKSLSTAQKQILARADVKLSTLTEQQVIKLVNRESDVEHLSDDQLVEFIKIANATYRGGNRIIPDEEYDFTYLAELRNRNPHHPYLSSVEPESAFEGKTVELPVQMLSTEKKHSKDDVKKWLAGIKKEAADVGLEFDQVRLRVTPKLDGFAAYDDGQHLYTRGDGRRGTDITRVFERGLCIGGKGGRGQGAGEIVISDSYFAIHLASKFENTRNFQASIIREKDLDPLTEQAISNKAAVFFPFAALPSWEGSIDEFLSKFDEVAHEVRNSVGYDVDGIIIEVANEDIRRNMGASRHHHRWQLAYKENLERAKVIVLNVRPQTSRSGRVNPVAEFEPTRLSGATLRNVTAHHYGMVIQKGIGPGAEIELIRSGLDIPKIENVLIKAEPKIPELCPSCQTRLIWEKDYLICPNTSDCPAQIENTLEHFFKTLRNIDGFGSQTIKKLYANGIKTVHEVYLLDKDKLIQMGFGEKKTPQNLLDQLQRSRTEPLEDWRFLAAFGIYHMGLGMCERLLQHYRLADVFDLTMDELESVEGFAEVAAKAVVEGLHRIKNRFWNLYHLGFNIQNTQLITEGLESKNSPIAGKLIVFTGAMKSGSREDLKSQAKALGAHIASSVTGKTDILVIGENVGTIKMNDAKEKGAEIITEDDYLALISKNPEKLMNDLDLHPDNQLSLFK